MGIVKEATKWAKAEIVSAMIFMLAGIVYIVLAFTCWTTNGSPLIDALPIPILIAGGLLLAAGIGFYTSNKSRLKSFEADYQSDPNALISSEIERTQKTIKSYEKVALRVFPGIILIAAMIYFSVQTPITKAICVGIIAFLFVIVLLDSQALKRMRTYHQKLISENKI